MKRKKNTSKRKNLNTARRRVRRQENANLDEASASHDKTIGRACRRFYGCGKAL